MAERERDAERRHRGRPIRIHTAGPRGKPVMVWAVAAISLALVTVPVLLLNQQHSGDRLKIRRELRKF